MTAAAAADACEATVQIAAFEKTFEHVLFDRAAHATRSAQLPKVAADALPQRTGPRFARAIDRWPIGLHATTNARPLAADECRRRPDDMAARQSTRPAVPALEQGFGIRADRVPARNFISARLF